MIQSIRLTGLSLLLLLVAQVAARAEDAAVLATLVGQDEAEAVSWLESHGLRARVITLAQDGARPGEVLYQEPPAGDAYAANDEVVLHVAVRVNIPTLAPSVTGLLEREAVAALGDAYFLEVEYTSGAADREGRVIAQHPSAGTQVPYRSLFKLRIVRNAAVVPALLQRTEAEARRLLHVSGLRADVSYVQDAAGVRGTVISQDPRSGAETIPGATVALRVVGIAPEGPGAASRVSVPPLVGLLQTSAERALLDAGLSGHMHWVNSPTHPPYTVVSQEVAPGTLVDEGSDVGFDVARPRVLPSQVTLPNLFGMSESHALGVLTGYGLGVRVLRAPAPFPVGTVFEQDPAAGSVLSRGATVDLKVSLAPPPNWTAPPRTVPDVQGMEGGQARVVLLLAGYIPHKRHGLAPDAELGKVFAQDPAAGTAAPFGTRVDYRIPYTSRVPELLGKTREEADALLATASLVAHGQRTGPAGPGATQVVWQQVAAGAEVARGSILRFRFKVLSPALAPVPQLVGVTKDVAQARLSSAGFTSLFILEGGFGPTTRVTSQFPVAGAMRPVGSLVRARYVRIAGVLQRAVPDVVGKTQAEAVVALEADGFVAQMVLQGGVGPNTRVVSQLPVGGSLRPVGSTVVARYVRTLGVVLKAVPQVMGMTREQAKTKLEAAGFVVHLVDAGGQALFSSTRVIAQNPVAGTIRAVGSTVGVSWQRTVQIVGPGLLPGLLREVPNVVGWPLGMARTKLEAAGFEVALNGIGNRVVNQTPNAGQQALRGSTVRIRLGF